MCCRMHFAKTWVVRNCSAWVFECEMPADFRAGELTANQDKLELLLIFRVLSVKATVKLEFSLSNTWQDSYMTQ